MSELQLRRFVRALLSGATARSNGTRYRVGGNMAADGAMIGALIADGVLDGDEHTCRANARTAAWLRAKKVDRSARPPQPCVNIGESPLTRLGQVGADGRSFLEAHQLEAGERLRRLIERAQLQPRLTMSYSASRTAGGQRHLAADITDTAADARKKLDVLYRALPAECMGVLVDVCGFLKGLQQVESERGWPRRSAKLVLRIGLDQLARQFGLDPHATGPSSRTREWMADGARPERFE